MNALVDFYFPDRISSFPEGLAVDEIRSFDGDSLSTVAITANEDFFFFKVCFDIAILAAFAMNCACFCACNVCFIYGRFY